MVLKDGDMVRMRRKDDGCDKQKSCGNYVHYRGACLFKEKSTGRCKLEGKEKGRAGLSPAGGIL